MSDKIHCDTHGETQRAFVCSHLVSPSAGLGFNCDEPTKDNLYPDAWCDDCNLIFQTHQGWNEETEKLVSIKLLCSGCYELARVRNRRTDVTLEDLGNLRWKCHTCEEWHSGPCVDFSFGAPTHWSDDDHPLELTDLEAADLPPTFLTEDVCVINGEHFFIRGLIHLPIIGTAETFRWGVWGSLSKDNFGKLMSMWDDPKRAELPPMFSWLSNNIQHYPDTLNLKMYAHIKEPWDRPTFELEPTDHPLSQEYYHGISAERVKQIMTAELRETE